MSEIEYLKKYYKGNLNEEIKRYENGEPVQYIVGNVDFYGNIIEVDKRVLIPRFETEELVSRTINYIKNNFKQNVVIADIGTGSGCIAITLKKELPNSKVYGIDISKEAIELAKLNSLKNNVEITFICGNLLDPLKDNKIDILISNPPYISINDKEIMDIVKNNEPKNALYAKDNGLYYYKEIIKNSLNILNKKSIIAFEIGYKQGNEINKIANQYFKNAKIIVEKDLQEKDRFLFILNNCE